MVTSTFSDPVVLADSRDLFSAFLWYWETDSVSGHSFPRGVRLDPHALPDSMAEHQKHHFQLLFSKRHFFAFLIQAMIFMTLCSDTSLPLRAPSLPYINPTSSSSYDHQPSEPQQDTSFSFWPKPPPRPWLQNRPAGTLLAELLSSAEGDGDDSDSRRGRRLWAGYYVVRNDVTDDSAIDAPIFLELYSIKGPNNPIPFSTLEPDLSERINFQGEGP